MRVAHDGFSRVSGVVHQNFLSGDQDVYRVTVGFYIEGSIGRELHQVHAGQVAGGVIEEHVLAARIAGVDSVCVLAGVPAVDCGVVLHTRVTAMPCGFGNHAHQIFGFVVLYGATVFYGVRGEAVVADDVVHEVIGHADGVVGVLKEDGAVGIGIGRRAVVALRYQCVSFGFFFLFAEDEFFDVGMVYVQDDHLRGAASFASRLDYAGESVEALHEA